MVSVSTSRSGPAEAASGAGGAATAAAATAFFDALAEAQPTYPDASAFAAVVASAEQHGSEDASFYAWQLMALLALLVDDAGRKRTLVLALRERILLAVRGGDPARIAHVDILLHSLGLDSSQLA
jgi:hypothetical protein